jgi:hypothetical protein
MAPPHNTRHGCPSSPPHHLQDFYAKECWAHHPLPYADFVDFKAKEHDALEGERKKAYRV